MTTGWRSILTAYKIKKIEIEKATSISNLRAWLDSKLAFAYHTNCAVRKASRILETLVRSFNSSKIPGRRKCEPIIPAAYIGNIWPF